MEDERIVPVPVSKLNLGFCGNVRPGTVARASPQFCHLPCPKLREPLRGARRAVVFSRVGGALYT